MNCYGCSNLRTNTVDNTHYCILTGVKCSVKTEPHPIIMGNGVPSLGIKAIVPEVECENGYVSTWGK